MIVLPGPASEKLGKKVAQILKAKVIPVYSKKFPDGESYIRIEGDVKDEKVVVVQTTCPPQEVNLMQLFLMADSASSLGASEVIAAVPYLAYSRQDKRFLRGEAVSVETVEKLLSAAGVIRLVTVNVHEEKVLRKFGFPAESCSAMRLLAEHFVDKGLRGAFALAPDDGSVKLAEEAGEVLGGESGWLHKERNLYTGKLQTAEKRLKVRGKDAVVFDDIISTGGTTANAVKILKAQGARRVYAACAHPLLIGDARDKILGSGAEGIVGTDTVQSSVSLVSVAPLIAKAIVEKGT